MALASKLVYVDLQSATACSSASGNVLSWPTFTAGGVVTISLRFLEGDGNLGYIQKAQNVANLRAGMGVVSGSPNTGSFQIKVNGSPTTSIPYNCEPKRVQDALNALVGPTDPFIVEQNNDALFIRRVSGGSVNFDTTNNTLRPFSSVSFLGTLINGQWTYRMIVKNVPLAFTDTAFQILPDSPKVTILQHGGESPGGIVWPTVQDIYVPPTFQGTYQFTRNLAKTPLMDITDGPQQVQKYINQLLATTDPGPPVAAVTVTNPTSYHVNVTFGANGLNDPLLGADVPALGVNVYSAPPGDWSFSLDLGSAEMMAAFAGKPTLSLQFECEGDFYESAPISGQPLPATRRVKLWSQPVTIKQPMISADMNTVQLIDWAQPATGKDYVPFSRDQIITGQQNYTASFGDGSATTFEITHRLNTDAIASVCVRQNTSNGRMLVEGTDYTVIFTDSNSLSLVTAEPPEANALSVTIMASGVSSAFEAHTHTIQQVITLEDQLSQLSLRLSYLEGLVPHATSISVTTSMPDQVTTFPSFGEMLPDLSLENTNIPNIPVGHAVGSAPANLAVTSQVSAISPTAPIVVIPGTPLKTAVDADATRLAIQKAVDATKTTNDTAIATAVAATVPAVTPPLLQSSTITTFMVPAITGSGTTGTPLYWPPARAGGRLQRLPSTQRGTASSVSTLPSVTQAGVYQASTALSVVSSMGRKRFTVPAGAYFASDGSMFYSVASAGTNVWYPTEMDRELSRTFIPAQSFPVGATMSMAVDLTTILNTPGFDSLGINLGCEYNLRIQAIPVSSGVAGTPSILLSTPLAFSTSTESRDFTLTAKRDGSASSVTIYGTATPGASLPDGDFVLVVDLTAFDVDTTQIPVGQIGLTMNATKISITK